MQSTITLSAMILVVIIGTCCAAPVRPATIEFGTTLAFDVAYSTAGKIAGIQAALKESNTANELEGTTLSVRYASTSTTVNDPASTSVVQTLVNTHGVFGLFANDYFSSVAAFNFADPLNIPVIAPVAISNTLFKNTSRNAVNYRSDLGTEGTQLINFMINSQQHCWNIVVFYYNETEIASLATKASEELQKRGYPAPLLIALPTSGVYDVTAALNTILADTTRNFRCWMVYDAFAGFKQLLDKAFEDPRFYALQTRSETVTSFFAPSVATSPGPMVNTQTGKSTNYTNVYLAQVLPDPTNTDLPSVAKFKAAIDNFATTDWPANIPTTVRNAFTNRYSYEALEGYTSARLLIEILKSTTSLTRAEVLKTVYRARLFSVEDIILGPYTDGCSNSLQKIDCWCNSGTRIIYMTRINSTTGLPYMITDTASKGEKEVAFSNVGLEKCSLQPSDVKPPINVALASISNGSPFGALFTRLYTNSYLRAAVAAVNLNDLITTGVQMRLRDAASALDASNLGVAAFMKAQYNTFGSIMAVGPYSLVPDKDLMLTVVTTEYKMREQDPPVGSYADWAKTFIFLDASLADHIHVLTKYAYQSHGSLAVFAENANLAELATKSSHTYEKELGSRTIIPSSADVNYFSGRNGVMLVASQNETHVAAALLQAITDRDAIIYLATSEAVLSFVLDSSPYNRVLHPTLTRSYRLVLQDPAVRANLYFASIHDAWWMPTNSLSPFYGSGHAHFGIPYGFYVGTAAFEMANKIILNSRKIGVRTETEGVDAIYTSSTVSAAAVSLGPFSAIDCQNAAAGTNCQCNKGPRRYYVHSAQDWATRAATSATQSYAEIFDSCWIQYRALPEEESNAQLIMIAAIAGGGVVVLSCALIIVVVRLNNTKTRDNSAAPKDESKPFTIVFTDIQSSTNLWARAPEAMSFSVEQHHNEIRKLVSKYHGYEVKTIGDSFMVAFQKTTDAVQFSIAIQAVFYKLEWPKEIDGVYLALQQEKMEAELELATGKDALKISSSMAVDLNEYAKNWNGVRVRVGCHHGFGNIKLDPVSMGYDYYGTVVNTGARVEGVGNGGQVLLTEDAVSALVEENANLSHLYDTTDLGPQPLRGLDAPVRLVQFLPKEIPGRTFGALRLDVEKVVDDDDEEEELVSHISASLSATAEQQSTHADAHALDVIDKFLEKKARKWKGDLEFAGVKSQMMEHYLFLKLFMSTARTQQRREVLESLAARWQVVKNEKLPPDMAEKVLLANTVFKVQQALEASTHNKVDGRTTPRALSPTSPLHHMRPESVNSLGDSYDPNQPSRTQM